MTTKEQTPLDLQSVKGWRSTIDGSRTYPAVWDERHIDWLIGEVERLTEDLEMSRLGFETVDEIRVAANARAERLRRDLEWIAEVTFDADERGVVSELVINARAIKALADDAKEEM